MKLTLLIVAFACEVMGAALSVRRRAYDNTVIWGFLALAILMMIGLVVIGKL